MNLSDNIILERFFTTFYYKRRSWNSYFFAFWLIFFCVFFRDVSLRTHLTSKNNTKRYSNVFKNSTILINICLINLASIFTILLWKSILIYILNHLNVFCIRTCFLQKKMFGLRINRKVFLGSHNLYKCNIWDFYRKNLPVCLHKYCYLL